jgi:phage gpG-like protein
LSATLHRAAANLAKLGRQDAAASALVASTARTRAPRRSGALAASVRAEPREGNGAVVAAAPYAAYVEFGVPSRSIPARPFMAGALKATAPAVTDLYADETRRVMSQVKGA